MKASERRLRRVKQSGKMGGLHKDNGSYGFNGSANLSHRAGGWHAQRPRWAWLNARHRTNPPCGLGSALIPSATSLPAASRAALSFPAADSVQKMRPAQSTPNIPKRVSPPGADILVCQISGRSVPLV